MTKDPTGSPGRPGLRRGSGSIWTATDKKRVRFTGVTPTDPLQEYR